MSGPKTPWSFSPQRSAAPRLRFKVILSLKDPREKVPVSASNFRVGSICLCAIGSLPGVFFGLLQSLRPLPLCDVTTPLPPSLPGCLDHLQQLRQHDCNNTAAQQSATEDNKWWRWWPAATWWCDWNWTLNALMTFSPTDPFWNVSFSINRNMYQH